MTHERIRLGISACLLGEPVRFDGGHKRDPFLVASLGQFVDWGAGVPRGGVRLDAARESMRLVQTDVRLEAPRSAVRTRGISEAEHHDARQKTAGAEGRSTLVRLQGDVVWQNRPLE